MASSEVEKNALEKLLQACEEADAEAGQTTIKPIGQKHQRVVAIPVPLWELVRKAMENAKGVTKSAAVNDSGFSPQEVSEHTCPKCGGDNFARDNGTPVTIGGWHGGKRYAWVRYAGVHMVRCTGKRCEDCGHEEPVVVDWD